MDLGEAGVGEGRALLVGPPDRGGVGTLGVGGEVEHVAVAAGAEDHGVAGMRLDLPGDHVARHDAARPPVDEDQVQHLVAGEHLHLAEPDLPLERLIGPQQELLAGLAPRVERARDLRAPEGPVGQQPAVLAREGHALGHALVDDLDAQLGEPVDVPFPRAVVAALDRVVEQAEDAVAVVLVVLGRVDPALGRDRMRPPRAVLVAVALDVVAQLGQRCRGGGAGEARAHHEDRVLALVRGVHQLHLEAVLLPFPFDRALGNVGAKFHQRRAAVAARDDDRSFSRPVITAMGNERLPSTTSAVMKAAKA